MLILRNVSCGRGGHRLFGGVHLKLSHGQWAHVRGANGAGKTSLLRTVAGLSPADGGEVLWNGQAAAANRASYHADLLFLGHLAGLKDDLTPVENLRAANELDGVCLHDGDALRALFQFGLRGCENVPARRLSAGQRRRVLLARTITRPARLWLLDEPLTALDACAIDVLSSVIAGHLAGGGMAMITSHQPLPLAAGLEIQL